jgi:glycosidase
MRLKWICVAMAIIYCPGQLLATESINPTISPALFQAGTSITVTYDVTGTPLASLASAWAWLWIPGKSDAKSNINPASSNSALTAPAMFTKSVVNGHTLFTLTFVPSSFFAANITSETKIGMLLKGNDWPNGQTTDYIASFWDGSFQAKLVSPTQQPLFVHNGQNISVQVETPVTADFNLYVNNSLVNTQSSLQTYQYQLVADNSSPDFSVDVVATSGTSSSTVHFNYLLSTPSPLASRPAGIKPGINYDVANTGRATLCLLAPGKSSVYAFGDFSNWDVKAANIMNRDGEFFWIQINGLTPGTEYGFQYLVDETLKLADPFADKILDPDDQAIPSSTYPSLKSYPAKALNSQWYFNRVAVLQTNQPAYTWQAGSYQRPKKEKLVIYELLIRDMFGPANRNYQSLIDTLSYFKRLGVNAIELMPVTEFNGNDSWGYNPTFMFAPDKYYGTKNKLKEFVDKCHLNGIAVILDIVMNHQDIPNPYAMMDFDFVNFKPTANNKWFNVNATHPFSVFNDLNHESTYTKAYLDTITHYWINQYKVDGYRFDLSKGFTQTNNPNNVNAWSAYDASRIAILKRMADKIWAHTPDAFIILEHFADNTEEKELAEYRSGEGKGMMLWGNANFAYNQNTMGYGSGADFSYVAAATRGWSVSNLVGYMESHDEERLMYKNIQFGNSAGEYNVKNVNTGLERMKAANLAFLTVPGPKMIWEFGELGYDLSINTCPDGTISNDCRISAKPVKWSYRNEVSRKNLENFVADLNRIRKTYDVFTLGDVTFQNSILLTKSLTVKNKPYTATPANVAQMNAHVLVNFDITQQSFTTNFPHTGTWFDYYGNSQLQVSSTTQAITLPPGGYKLFTDVQIPNQLSVIAGIEPAFANTLRVYPNPATDLLYVDMDGPEDIELKLMTIQGQPVSARKVEERSWDISTLSAGLYIGTIESPGKSCRVKIVKK